MPHAAFVVVAFVLMLQTSARPPVLGNAAARVTAEDLSAISQIVGEPFWLMRIENWTQRSGEQTWATNAYLMPDRETPELRQGRVMLLTNRGARPDPSRWSPVLRQGQTTTKWVQVQLRGRMSTDVRSTADPNWPIAVSGQLSDTDLISLVQFVRSGPVLSAGSRHGRANTRLAPDRRISSIDVNVLGRRGGAGPTVPGGSSPVQVALTTETECEDVFRLERLQGEWSATYTGGACG
jgi:hypothetical protein